MATAIQIQAAEHECDLAYFGGASSETVLAVQRELMALEQAAESTDERCLRLGVKAMDKDAEAERHLLAAADAAGLAAGRRLAGNDDQIARSYDREVAHCTAAALGASAEAERLRSQCAALRRAQEFTSMIREAAE